MDWVDNPLWLSLHCCHGERKAAQSAGFKALGKFIEDFVEPLNYYVVLTQFPLLF